MNTEKYIEIAIFAVITGLLSGTGSYFVNKKIEKLKEKRKKKKEKRSAINLINIASHFKKLISIKS